MIKIENLTKTYNYKKSNAFTALTDVSLTVEDGEMLAIIGKSGAGKSTLLHIIGCIDTFEKGTYTLDDISVHKLSDKKLAQIRNQKVGIVMQDFALVEEYTVLENVQKQRVAIARAIVNNPSFLLADEPTGALDTKTSAEIMALFKSLNDEGKTVIIITHDPTIAGSCQRQIEISDGKIIE